MKVFAIDVIFHTKVDGIEGWLLKFFPYFKDGRFRYESSLKTKDIWRLPDKILKTPLMMRSDDEGETKMTIYSGFFGMSVNKEDNNLVTAEIGWFVKKKDKDKGDHSFRIPRPLRPLGVDDDSEED